MIQQGHKELTIYWGDKEYSIDVDSSLLERKKICKTISSVLGADEIVALKQTHSSHGYLVSDLQSHDRFVLAEGDYLITQEQNKALTLFTADCVPLILYNPENKTIAAVHVGWKGAVANIIQHVCNHALFRSNMPSVEAFIGPSAQECCYEVQADFLEHLDEEEKEKCIVVRDEKIYYNNSLFIRIKLKSLGILDRKIYTDFNICTVCSEEHCSYRRDREIARRNVTVAFLR